ncbi:MAG: lytic murein transglycosylase [Ketobacteraceae bacterium]|nr:lytic murein transglycosylase [Ketobacteraceae bacterium]
MTRYSSAMKNSVKTFLFLAGILCCGTLQASAEFSGCIERLKHKALQASISESIVDDVFRSIKYSPRVIELDRKQPEFSQTFYNYYRQRVTEFRVEKGRELLQQHGELLRSLTREYGVPAHYLVAFWGMETNFGRYLGKMDTLDSLATLACDERRSEFFTAELLDALRLIDSGTVDRHTMAGSWAGAMGNMQFMPSTYRRFGLDADKDGKVDMWTSLDDAFTSAAFYLNRLGWEKGWRWGREVLLPEGFDYSIAGLDNPKALSDWVSLGITDTHNKPLPKLEKNAYLIVPAGYEGPAFLVYDNFRVIMKWNYSEFYALSVGILADRIKGAKGLKVPPPETDNYTVAEIKEIQSALQKLGFDVGHVDGIFGSQSKKALQQFQKANSLIADGFPHPKVVKKLKSMASI